MAPFCSAQTNFHAIALRLLLALHQKVLLLLDRRFLEYLYQPVGLAYLLDDIFYPRYPMMLLETEYHQLICLALQFLILSCAHL